MAIFLSNGVVVTLDSVDLSDHVTSATINRVFDELEVTTWVSHIARLLRKQIT
jgi:hypothetical protein